MACISTRPSPALPSDDLASHAPECATRLAQLQRENHKLKRINAALIERLESGAARPDDAFAAFQHSVVLAEQVRERTDALNQALIDLKASHLLLSDAHQRAETAHLRLVDAIESISDAFVLFDHDLRVVLFNRRFKALWANSRLRMSSGMHLMEVKRLMHSLLREEPRGSLDEQPLYRLRNERWLQVSERPTRDGGRVMLFTDVTRVKQRETRRREQALAQKSYLLQRAVDNLSQGLAMVNAEGVLELWNRRFLELSGLAPIASQRLFAEVIGDSELALLTPESRDSVGNVLQELEQRLFDGRLLEIRTHPLPAGGFVNTFTDITERYAQAEALHQAYQHLEARVHERTAELTSLNRQLLGEIDQRRRVEACLREAKAEADRANLSKTKFLAAVSHDLLQPLNAARLFTSALLEQREPGLQPNLVRNVSNSLDGVENLLGTLVDISKLDAGVIKADIASFALRDLLDTLAAEHAQVALSEGLRLDYIPTRLRVRSDIQLLARILRNLLSNAIRYTPHGRILLGCRRRGRKVWIEVWDTGVGIAADKCVEVFQEFKRGEAQRPDQDRGLGLGLAIVEKIAGILGHAVHLRSVPGKGSVFSVEVPRCRRAPRRSALPAAEMPLVQPLEGARIWVLDNDAAICAGMSSLLQQWGCQVVTALSEADLERQVALERAKVDLLIADYHLDDQRTGVDAVTAINARRHRPIPVLMITANYSNELKQQVRELGHTLMHKPVRPMKLKMAMSHLLSVAGAR
ncbi:response regulator [Pseudomonas capeferrum]|uniref:PAS domain-containing hybrid sensor histidine kinase/response regulator n=1 Tax=Pseudomonas capeferrum TaxID=1495066 RepID=UPI0015E3198B|nr:NahK/ErcS family hybrid sensor histidine kinase/response regulator [Pseudomonas capeferrum]MBA1202619.1 response regulator [Pseudomonas capeferrum]